MDGVDVAGGIVCCVNEAVLLAAQLGHVPLFEDANIRREAGDASIIF